MTKTIATPFEATSDAYKPSSGKSGRKQQNIEKLFLTIS